MKEFFKSSLRTTIAIFLALIGIAIAIGIFTWAKDFYDTQQAKPFEEVRNWKFDLKDSIGLEAQAKTKLVAGNLLVSAEIIGHPKYLSDPKNINASFIFEFLDKDGFKIISKPLKLSEFTTVIGKNGEKIGLNNQFTEYIGLEQYKRFNQMQVGWNFETETTTANPLPLKQMLDHCAPNISKAERLRRLAQHGTLRETGPDEYTASGHLVQFLHDGALLTCR